MEAVPTVLILLALLLRNEELFLVSGPETNFLGIDKGIMFLTTFSISVFSGAFGMAKFLKLGPCQIVPSQAMHCGFFSVMISMAAGLVSKGGVLAFILPKEDRSDGTNYATTIWFWICICIVPQLMLVSIETNP